MKKMKQNLISTGNNIGEEGARMINESLTGITTLTELDLASEEKKKLR